MSLSQVPRLTLGGWGVELELELHQQTRGSLMVNTHTFLLVKVHILTVVLERYRGKLVCVTECVIQRHRCFPPAARWTVTLCLIGMLLVWLSNITALGAGRELEEDIVKKGECRAFVMQEGILGKINVLLTLLLFQDLLPDHQCQQTHGLLLPHLCPP